MDEAKDQNHDSINRRRFLRVLMWSSLAFAVVESAFAAILMAWPRRGKGFGSRVSVGSVDDFPVGTVTKNTGGRFYLVHLPEGFIALHWRCTHLGCTVPWVPETGIFQCPCHGSQFDKYGRNLSGPAPRPLDIMDVTVQAGQVVVDTGAIHERQAHRPEHVTQI